ncbi:Alpha/Beta hydrolase protein [Xylariaceae sp. FL0594]|nr:Alpha/Beta hydrolase protein [Xylariaceae sp. FL0594]
MLFVAVSILHLFYLGAIATTLPISTPTWHASIQDENADTSGGVSANFFASLERLSRLVDIAYCVGTSGIRQPFSCISRCKDFPSLELVTTWNTGALLGDSCGYIAVDHAVPTPLSGLRSGADGAQIPMGRSDGAIIVAFRGTYSMTNTVIDLSTVPQKYVPYPPLDDGEGHGPGEPEHACTNCTVHMGFLMSWQIARQVVMPELKRLHEQYPGYPIHIVGHSLGGAVGALAALEMKVGLGWDDVGVTTFGEPRVGNAGFTKYLDAAFDLQGGASSPEQRSYRRITHIGDPVPLLPLSEWGYRPHAGEFFISKPELYPKPSDIRPCHGDYDPECIAGSEGESEVVHEVTAQRRSVYEQDISSPEGVLKFPLRLKLWEILFAHRDYFWRLGLCIPGGDPIDWGRDKYEAIPTSDEL